MKPAIRWNWECCSVSISIQHCITREIRDYTICQEVHFRTGHERPFLEKDLASPKGRRFRSACGGQDMLFETTHYTATNEADKSK